MYASYSLRTGEAIKESVVCESTEFAVIERIDVESMAMPDEFYTKQCSMSDVFIVLFISLPHIHYLHVFAVLVISPHPLQQCTSYRGSTQILSRRQYAPNKQCALK